MYKHTADGMEARAGEISEEELMRFLDRVAEKYCEHKKTTLDEWIEVKL